MVEEGLPGVGVFGALGAEAIGGPLHVGEEMGRLHGGDDAFFFEAVEVAGKQNLGVFDAEAEGGGGWWALLRLGDDVGVGAVFGRGWRVVGDLVGDAEGVQSHRVGAVADSVEA